MQLWLKIDGLLWVARTFLVWSIASATSACIAVKIYPTEPLEASCTNPVSHNEQQIELAVWKVHLWWEKCGLGRDICKTLTNPTHACLKGNYIQLGLVGDTFLFIRHLVFASSPSVEYWPSFLHARNVTDSIDKQKKGLATVKALYTYVQMNMMWAL